MDNMIPHSDDVHYLEGYEAFKKGLKQSDNKYGKDIFNIKRIMWDIGWSMANALATSLSQYEDNEAYKEGCAAAIAEKAISDNPYPPVIVNQNGYFMWMQGHMHTVAKLLELKAQINNKAVTGDYKW